MNDSSMNNTIECPICLDFITNKTGYIKLTCCNNPVHLICLVQWYGTNASNLCFLCKQQNTLCEELSLEPRRGSSSHRYSIDNNIELRETIVNINNDEQINLTNNIVIRPLHRMSPRNLKCATVCFLGSMISIIAIVLSVQLL